MPKKSLKKIIKKIPGLSQLAKLAYDWRQEKKLMARVRNFLRQKKLSFADSAPAEYGAGYEPTIRCNLRCKMCFQGENRSSRQEELSAADTLKFFGNIKEKVRDIKLVGGEPFMRSDIIDLISFWDKADRKIIIQTNCTLINEANISQLKNFKNLTDILTSLDGPQETHDLIRGVPGAFEKLKKAMDLIRQNMPGVPITVFATMLVNDNLDKFFELIDVAKNLGLGTINILFEQVYSSGDVELAKKIFKNNFGWEAGRDYRLNTQVRNPVFAENLDIAGVKNKLTAIRHYGLKRGCFVNFAPFNFYLNLEQYFGRKQRMAFCLKLLQPELRINPKGEVIWCDVIEKSFGNLLEKSVDEIWLSHEYQQFREYLFKNSLPICTRCCKAVYRENK